MNPATTPQTRPCMQEVAGPRLPLYLYGRGTRFEVDGPAFVALRPDRAPARYPFARISRIVSGPAVEWSAKALRAALQEKLPVVFLDADGTPVGYLHPAIRHPSRLGSLLIEFADRPDAPDLFNAWLAAERMHALRDWLTRHPGTLNPRQWREWVQRVVHRGELPQALQAEALFRGALHAYALGRTVAAGVHPTYWAPGGRPIEVARSLAELLLLRLTLAMTGLGTAVHGQDAALLRILHSFNAELDTRSREIFARLCKHLAELCERWP
jgi:hypothetical protein